MVVALKFSLTKRPQGSKLVRYFETSLTVHKGDWSNGMIGVSKTFGGSSILSSPVQEAVVKLEKQLVGCFSFI